MLPQRLVAMMGKQEQHQLVFPLNGGDRKDHFDEPPPQQAVHRSNGRAFGVAQQDFPLWYGSIGTGPAEEASFNPDPGNAFLTHLDREVLPTILPQLVGQSDTAVMRL